jgi:hypothetical protein
VFWKLLVLWPVVALVCLRPAHDQIGWERCAFDETRKLEAMKMKRILVLGLATMVSVCALAANLPFINDDYPKALAAAKQRDLPIFVEVWAPW